MMRHLLVPIVLSLVAIPLDTGYAQAVALETGPWVARDRFPARDPLQLTRPFALGRPRPVIPPDLVPSVSDGRGRRALLGGLLGVAVGVGVCTLISNAAFNEGGGFSTCTTKGNLLFAATGFTVGFTIGWLSPAHPQRE